ncbi:MAG: AAA family ATPase, partial [Candidatus Eremiobacteraeota bacterium]|nr:AAA family ATPase [Candidatus Eremiobacteraeota bacterium]
MASSTGTDKLDTIPKGNVVFLFSDIEGSTERWETKRVEMQSALRIHDEALHALVRAHNGYVFKTIGDQFCVAFQVAADAILAAVAIQKWLAGNDFSAVDGIRVRIAIHAGAADERSGDYFGPAVNRVARLLNAGHGGQILISEIVSEAIALGGLDSARAIDLGWHRLKGIEQPEHIFQLAADGLGTNFPALQSLTVTANNLPNQTTALIGRDHDLAAIEESIKVTRLVSITGVGGCGKTRVAIAAAAQLLQLFRDGAWFVNFAPLTDGSLVNSTILSALGVKQGNEPPARELLRDFCKAKSMLLVFDNCEHLIDEIARSASEILSTAQDVKILATSRE